MIGFQALIPLNESWNINHVWSITNNSHFDSMSLLQRGRFYKIRYGYHIYEPPAIELYTQFSLSTYSLVFLGVLSLQTFTIFLVDENCANTIPQNTKIWSRILHSIQKSHFPFPYSNWYKGDGNCTDHIKRKKDSDIEVLSTIFINLLFNMVMLIPLGILCKYQCISQYCKKNKIQSSYFFVSDFGILERHNQLNKLLGELEMEEESFERSQWFAWVFYPIFIILTILQTICFILSNGKFHPLAKILEICENHRPTPELG